MKRKVFSVLLCVFMFGFTNMKATSEVNLIENDPFTCWDVADNTVASFQENMLKLKKIATHAQEHSIWEAAYDICMGD